MAHDSYALKADCITVDSLSPGPGEQIVSAGGYPNIRLEPQRHDELLAWLRANGIDPNDVPIDSIISIAPDGGGHVIKHTVYLRDVTGHHYEDSATGDIAQEQRATPLAVPLPDAWPQPVGPVEPGTVLKEG